MQQLKIEKQTTVRDSGIELLKIFAIFVIVISHVVQTLTFKNPDALYQEYVIDITKATTDLHRIILLIFRHFGVWGDALFFISSAWFLLKAKDFKKKKWLFMFVEIWTVSVIILVITYVILHGGISGKILIESIFPTFFCNNWYLTCYLLFYPISPILNRVIHGMSKKQLFRSTSALAILYIFVNSILDDWFFSSTLILWVTIYFVIAYMQKYLMGFADNVKKNLIFALVNAVCFIGLILLTEMGGLHISFLSGQMMHWVNYCNPFIIFMSIAMFNIARNVHFKNRFINYISSLSMLVYIIHENIILRTYIRPAMWNYVWENFGYTNVLGWVFVFVIIVFLFGILSAVLYSATVQKIVKKVSAWLYKVLRKKYLWIENKILEKDEMGIKH